MLVAGGVPSPLSCFFCSPDCERDRKRKQRGERIQRSRARSSERSGEVQPRAWSGHGGRGVGAGASRQDGGSLPRAAAGRIERLRRGSIPRSRGGGAEPSRRSPLVGRLWVPEGSGGSPLRSRRRRGGAVPEDSAGPARVPEGAPPPRGKGDGAEQGRRHVTSRRRGECTSPQLPPRQRGTEVSPTTSMAGDEARPDLLLLDAIWRRIKLIRRGEGRCPRRRSWATSPGAR